MCNINDEHLIRMVRDRPCLYDKTNEYCKDAEKKRRAWSEIANDLQIDESLVERRWGNLRARFTKEIRKVQNASGSEGRQWPLLENLKFLERLIIPRPMRQMRKMEVRNEKRIECDNFCTETQLSEEMRPLIITIPRTMRQSAPMLECNVEVKSEKWSECDDFCTESQSSEEIKQSTSRASKRKAKELDVLDAAILDTVKMSKDVREGRTRSEEFSGEISGFGQMICSAISKMKKRTQAFVMKRCTEIVMQAQMEEDDDECQFCSKPTNS